MCEEKNKCEVTVIGAGLAGCEAAWMLAGQGIRTRLVEMKPKRFSPAHKNTDFAELVCSNSLKAERPDSAPGVLKREMRALHSIVLESADRYRVPAGGALAVDRELFAAYITKAINEHPLIEVVHEECVAIPEEGIVIIATGPLTSDALSREISKLLPEPLYFYDAAAPIVSAESIDMEHAFQQGRYDQPDDYINCPLTREEYEQFYHALLEAEKAELHDFEDVKHFEGCMPIEEIARRGYETPRFGPMSPKGIDDPRTGRWPYALVQLRRENAEGTMYNLVGFQTNLKFPEQKRVFGMIPALKNAEYLRYGVMHRNTYLHSPGFLDAYWRVKAQPRIRFAGQITGVEGYIESAASGIAAGLCTAMELQGKELPVFPGTTGIGALTRYVSEYNGSDFQPMNMNFGIMDGMEGFRSKKDRHAAMAERAQHDFEEVLRTYHIELP